MALSTDFVLRTGPFDHIGKVPKDDYEGPPACLLMRLVLTVRSQEALASSV